MFGLQLRKFPAAAGDALLANDKADDSLAASPRDMRYGKSGEFGKITMFETRVWGQ
jgi:hypothetical protein